MWRVYNESQLPVSVSWLNRNQLTSQLSLLVYIKLYAVIDPSRRRIVFVFLADRYVMSRRSP